MALAWAARIAARTMASGCARSGMEFESEEAGLRVVHIRVQETRPE